MISGVPTYRSLDAQQIVKTLERLRLRIEERFPGSGLSQVAGEVLSVAQENAERVKTLRRSSPVVRGIILFILVGAASLGAYLAVSLVAGRLDWAPQSGSELIQEVEAALGIVVFLGATVVYLASVDVRRKRVRALRAIHELRSLAHIVDMHQLIKDPERLTHRGPPTASSPAGSLSPFLLGRYLDYCSELLALIAKIAALYVQGFEDPIAVSAVDEIEDLTSGLSRKIWQKLMILDRMVDG